jgi:D-alanine-D-alanine ligase
MRARTRGGRRLRVGVIYGGRSVEHEVSLVSAKAIMSALDPDRYDVVPVLVARDGRWTVGRSAGERAGAASVEDLLGLAARGPHSSRRGSRRAARVDVIFPIVHGSGGEDGSLQGLLTLADLPFVGAGVLASALGMDKAAMKVMFHQAGLPIVRHRVVTRAELDDSDGTFLARLEAECGYPCFVKPSNGGSSVGVSKVRDRRGLGEALELAFRYDRAVLVEQGIDAREIECSVLGNENPEASVAGEIIPANEFYDYAAKYLDVGSRLVIPADLPAEQARLVHDLAIRAFRVLDIAGMARVDFFIDRDTGVVYLNEVNTLPGFTPISMYPKLWEASGLPFPRLVDRLIELALERHDARKALVTAFRPGGA